MLFQIFRLKSYRNVTWLAPQFICSQPLTRYSEVNSDGLTIDLGFVRISASVTQGDGYISWAEKTEMHVHNIEVK